MSLAYLVTDRIYETALTVSSAASDPNDPFGVPFTLQNNSHIFKIENISWICQLEHVMTDQHSGAENTIGVPHPGATARLDPGQLINVDCNVIGKTSKIVHLEPGAGRIIEAKFLISFKYDVVIFGYLWRREPAPTEFTWLPSTTYSQWIKGPPAVR